MALPSCLHLIASRRCEAPEPLLSPEVTTRITTALLALRQSDQTYSLINTLLSGLLTDSLLHEAAPSSLCTRFQTRLTISSCCRHLTNVRPVFVSALAFNPDVCVDGLAHIQCVCVVLGVDACVWGEHFPAVKEVLKYVCRLSVSRQVLWKPGPWVQRGGLCRGLTDCWFRPAGRGGLALT